ncbi:hypothetical protein QR680_009556 [Steinernema hermaphroditum]|uniref:Membrane-associated protein n=1 Tax=Steinernema hermaphroditum TaxID=289476 RepID=A0AA39M936_9BILA|nr:hypothetical protein QR680_009556 [Steinernema hermaphroditum]
MRLVFVLTVAAVGFLALSDASEVAAPESNSGPLVLLAVFLLVPVTVVVFCCFTYLFFVRGAWNHRVRTQWPEGDVESSEEESRRGDDPRPSATAFTAAYRLEKTGEAKQPLDFRAIVANPALAECPKCSLRSPADSSTRIERPETSRPSYEETMLFKRAQPIPTSAVRDSWVEPNCEPKIDASKAWSQSAHRAENPTQRSRETLSAPLHSPFQAASHTWSMPSRRKFSVSTEETNDFDDNLVVNQMRSEDMIRPSQPIHKSRVRPPPVSAEAFSEISSRRSSSDTSISSVAQPRMIQIGYPTGPKYIAPSSSESVAAALAQRKGNTDSNIMYSQEHLIDFNKKDDEKQKTPITSATQQTITSKPVSSISFGPTQASNSPFPMSARKQPSATSGTQATSSLAPDMVSTRTAVEDMSISEKENSFKTLNVVEKPNKN